MLLSLIVVGSMLTANAQYFEHTYGTLNMEFPRSGTNTQVGMPGHVMAGATNNFAAPTPVDMTLTRTDGTGNIPAAIPFFNNAYRFTDNAGVQIGTQATRVVQLVGGPNNGNLFVVGNVTQPGGVNAIYGARFGGGGVFVVGQSYQLVVPLMNIALTSVRQSVINPGEVYACGNAFDPATGNMNIIVMKLNTVTAAIIWANTYSIGPVGMLHKEIATDLLESPYMPNGVPEVAVVGIHSAPGIMTDGFFAEFNAATGAPAVAVAQLYATVWDDQFQSIEVSNNPAPAGPDFVISGFSNGFTGGANYDVWTLKVSPNAAIVDWSTRHDYSIAGNNNFSFDIIERLNNNTAPPSYEYYVAGHTNNGVFGADDAVVDKLNGAGLGFPAGEFTYGGVGNDRAFQVDQYPFPAAGAPPGLATYGVTNSFPGPVTAMDDIYLVKSYFSGHSGVFCPYNLANFNSFNAPIAPFAIPCLQLNPLVGQPILNPMVFAMNDQQLCISNMNPAGSNLRLAPEAEEDQGGIIAGNAYPNPVDVSAPQISVDYECAADGTIEIKLLDIMGRVCMTQTMSVVAGKQTLTIDLGSNLATGIYQLQLINGTSVITQRVAVK